MKFGKKPGFTLGLASLLIAGMSIPALAGGIATPVVEAPVAAPVPVVQRGGADWTGGWIGGNLGYGDVEAGASDGDGVTYGIGGGYDYDFGTWVAGVGLDWTETDIDLGAGTDQLNDIARLKFRVGADLGRTLLYATAGPARASADIGGIGARDNGWFGGVGADYALTDQWTVGGELLTNRFDDFNNTGTDIRATTATVNVGFRF